MKFSATLSAIVLMGWLAATPPSSEKASMSNFDTAAMDKLLSAASHLRRFFSAEDPQLHDDFRALAYKNTKK